MNPGQLSHSLIIMEALRPICPPNILQLRAKLENDPCDFFEIVRKHLIDHSEYENKDINYCIDTCIEYCSDLTKRSNVNEIVNAIKELQKQI